MSEPRPSPNPLRLGAPPNRRATTTIATVTAVVVLAAAGVAGVGASVLSASPALGGALLAGAVLLAVPMVWLLLRSLRFGTWLDGTTLVVHGAIASRTCDLAAASDVAIEHELRGQLPLLVVQPPNGGRGIRLRLWTLGGEQPQPLPREQLLALADAVAPAAATGCPEPGKDEDGDAAGRVAAQLKSLATPEESAGPCGMCGSSGSGCAFLERNQVPNAQGQPQA